MNQITFKLWNVYLSLDYYRRIIKLLKMCTLVCPNEPWREAIILPKVSRSKGAISFEEGDDGANRSEWEIHLPRVLAERISLTPSFVRRSHCPDFTAMVISCNAHGSPGPPNARSFRIKDNEIGCGKPSSRHRIERPQDSCSDLCFILPSTLYDIHLTLVLCISSIK